jgi:IS5 family transposase
VQTIYRTKVSVYEMLDERPRIWFDHISRFARTVDREFLVLNGSQKLVETLALVDTMLAAQQYFTAFAGGRQPATKPDR